MTKFSKQAKKIATRYLIEKAAYLNEDSNWSDDEFECWKGWHEDSDNFVMWAINEGIESTLHCESWQALQCLMGK